jgi:Rieske 2Fe-2S family protein
VSVDQVGPGPSAATSPDGRTRSAPAHRLEPAAYLDPAWHDEEQHRLFARTWALVGDAAPLASPGDHLTATVGGAPLLVIVGDDGRLRAFHNQCRHRGMVMVEGCGSGCLTIRCGYHDWRYGLDGALRVVPQRAEQFPAIDPGQLGLLPAAVAVWEGMVFACPDPDVAPLADVLAGFPEAIGSVRPGLLPLVASADVHAACNWKLLVENHVDVYHLWYLHAESLGHLDHRRFEHRAVGRHWVSFEPLRRPGAGALEPGTTAIAHLDERDRQGLGAHLLFPNILFAASAELFMSYAVVPTGPATSTVQIRVRAEPGADGASLLAAARSFVDEDVAACERIQSAMASPWFAVGPLAREHEEPIATFHRHLLDAMGGPPPGPTSRPPAPVRRSKETT